MKRSTIALAILLVSVVAVAFVQIDDTHDQQVCGVKTHVHPDVGQVAFADLNAATPADGELQYCVDCLKNTEPCQLAPGPPDSPGTGALAVRRAGIWECLPGSPVVAVQPTPVAFSCPTPQVVQAFDGSIATTTCVSPGAGSCPAAPDTAVQWDNAGVCGGSAQLTWKNSIAALEIVTGTANTTPLLEIQSTSNTSSSGAALWLRSAGTSSSAGSFVSFDKGSASGTDQYLNCGVVASTGLFQCISNSTPNDVGTGTAWFQIDRVNNVIAFKQDGTQTVPGIGWVNDLATGWSYTSAGGGERTQHWITANGEVASAHRTAGAAVYFNVNSQFVLDQFIDTTLSTAGPVTEPTANKPVMELSTSRGAGTDIALSHTNIQEGQVLRVINVGTNPITFTSGAAQSTTGGALQTLTTTGCNIEFMAMGGTWYQAHPVAGC